MRCADQAKSAQGAHSARACQEALGPSSCLDHRLHLPVRLLALVQLEGCLCSAAAANMECSAALTPQGAAMPCESAFTCKLTRHLCCRVNNFFICFLLFLGAAESFAAVTGMRWVPCTCRPEGLFAEADVLCACCSVYAGEACWLPVQASWLWPATLAGC